MPLSLHDNRTLRGGTLREADRRRPGGARPEHMARIARIRQRATPARAASAVAPAL